MAGIEDTSGVVPLDLVALVLPDVIEEKTAGGVYIPDSAKTRMEHSVEKCTFISCGGAAFGDWAEKPEYGERVVIEMYAGRFVTGKDGRKYRLVRDQDILAILEE